MSTAFPVELLRKLAPVNQLTPDAQARLAHKTDTEMLGAGVQLRAADCSPWYLYVVGGALALIAKGKHPIKVAAGSARALEPIFDERAGFEIAQTLGPTRVARIDRSLYQTLRDLDVRAGCEVIEVEVTDTESRLFQEIFAAHSKGALQIPTMPEVAARLARMADDPEVGLPEITRVVHADPSVAGAIMQAANSALYCVGKPVGDLKSAVVRLGMALTRTLATSFALRQTFRISNPTVEKRMRALWEHSVDVSALSYVLARKLKGPDPESSLLGGLLHDIGVIPILSYIDQAALKPQPDELEETIRKLRVIVGVLVAGHWRLDPQLKTVIEEAREWMRESGSDPDICDIVQVAQHFHFPKEPQAEVLPPLDTLPAYRRLGLGATDTETILDDAAQEIAQVKAWLHG